MPNGKVNWESLHREIMAQSDERHKMELRIVGVITDGLQVLRDDMQADRSASDARIKCAENDIVGLKVADRRWGGIVGLFAAGAAALAAWFGQR